MLYDFNDQLILEHKGWWFLWETAWDSFRPIDNVQWDGQGFVFDDRDYCRDPTDPHYGYGSEVMKDLCELLGDSRHELPEESDCLRIGSPEWFFDRPLSLTACAPRDHASWKRMTKGAHSTCRRVRGRKFTRRSWD
jgi:hypothetical protein